MGAAATPDARGAGVALCLVSACGFGVMAIFATQAYDAGVGVTTLLAARFALAAALFWAIVGVRRSRRARSRRAGRVVEDGARTVVRDGARRTGRVVETRAGAVERDGAAVQPSRAVVMAALVLGAIGYSAQSGLFFSALRHIDVSLTSLLLYTFPALVCVGAVALGRERLTALGASALGLASAGTALVLLGGAIGGLDATGVLLGLGAGVTYSAYILVADGVIARIDAWLFSALVATGAAATFLLTGLVSGALAPGQVLGAALVLAAVVALAWPGALRGRRSAQAVSVEAHGASPQAAGLAPARTPASEPA